MTTLEFEDLISQTNEPIYKIGDIVCSKVTGFPGVGRIVASMPALTFCGLKNDFTLKRWDIFEGWRQDYVYMVLFDEPRRYATFEEYISGISQEVQDLYKEGALEKLYEMQTQLVRSVI